MFFDVLSEILSSQKKQLQHRCGKSSWICEKAGGLSESGLHGKVMHIIGKVFQNSGSGKGKTDLCVPLMLGLTAQQSYQSVVRGFQNSVRQ